MAIEVKYMRKIVRPLVYDRPIISREKLSPEDQRVLEAVGTGKRVLEVGCSAGYFTKHLCDQGCIVTGIEMDQEAAQKAESFAESVIAADAEDPVVWHKLGQKFDVIIFMHVLEHLVDPWQVLCNAKEVLAEDGFIIVVLPNVACWQIRKQIFFRGHFQYQKYGILDLTHLRFFTYYTAQDLIKEAGYVIKEYEIVGYTVPFAGILRKMFFLKNFALLWEKIMIRCYPNLCGSSLFFKAVVK
jgi:2-polyprenyl-3-methyl-5-hydroxy-6-metoxy-1,4-benzoquinol methylase